MGLPDGVSVSPFFVGRGVWIGFVMGYKRNTLSFVNLIIILFICVICFVFMKILCVNNFEFQMYEMKNKVSYTVFNLKDKWRI